MTIKYLKHSEIDKSRWDQCVSSAPNGLFYGMSWYLDLVCPNWDALVLNTYDAVMPLPWKKKFGVKYIYHPWFAQQLGIFDKEPAILKVPDFIKAIPRKFIRYEISFNYLNTIKYEKAQPRNNYVLPLTADYATLYSSFNENTQRNIKKANKSGFAITRNITPNLFFTLMMQEVGFLMDKKHQIILENLIAFLTQNQYAELVGVLSENGDLLGAVCLVRFKNRLVYLFSASIQQGKDLRIMFKIVDEIIKENCDSPVILDFEGSMIFGIARFYQGFGSRTELYHRLQHTRFCFI